MNDQLLKSQGTIPLEYIPLEQFQVQAFKDEVEDGAETEEVEKDSN